MRLKFGLIVFVTLKMFIPYSQTLLRELSFVIFKIFQFSTNVNLKSKKRKFFRCFHCFFSLLKSITLLNISNICQKCKKCYLVTQASNATNLAKFLSFLKNHLCKNYDYRTNVYGVFSSNWPMNCWLKHCSKRKHPT